MNDLSERARTILRQYREAESLPSGKRNELLGELRERMVHDVPSSHDVDVPAPHRPGTGFLGSSTMAGKIAIAVGVIIVAAVPPIVRSRQRADRTQSTIPMTSVLPRTDFAAAPPASLGAPVDAPVTSAPADLAPFGNARPATKGHPEPATEGTVDEEVRLLTAAQAAIRAGQPAQGLALLDQHAARFPKGKLSEARDVAHMMAQCALGNRDASRREVERFLRHSPRSPYADRVQRICTSNQ